MSVSDGMTECERESKRVATRSLVLFAEFKRIRVQGSAWLGCHELVGRYSGGEERGFYGEVVSRSENDCDNNYEFTQSFHASVTELREPQNE